ncbi:MAG: L,D-transpeptidase [Fibrobacteres bacterium]|nr:L,D-transpeptidase [Fibrobacterota bacterium]
MTGAALVFFSPEPPVELIEKSRQSIAAARRAETELYVPRIYSAIDSNWRTLLNRWTFENERLFFRRDFADIITTAQKIDSLSKSAIRETDSLKKSFTIVTKVRLESSGNSLRQFKERYGELPIPKKIRNKASTAEMLHNEATSAYKRKEFQVAFNKCVSSAKLIDVAESDAHSIMKEYYGKLSTWRTWASNAIAASKKRGGAAIVVDKMAKRCRLYVGGKLKADFNAELGSNWMGDKRLRGDRATPEGQYHITMKKGARQSKYYKALLINYPNEADRKEFKASGRKGSIGQLGGLIEIHGHGGKGANWTEGCVALQNNDIDRLFGMVAVGTPVVIVGALDDPPEYLK